LNIFEKYKQVEFLGSGLTIILKGGEKVDGNSRDGRMNSCNPTIGGGQKP
jgi:hypothetical protein